MIETTKPRWTTGRTWALLALLATLAACGGPADEAAIPAGPPAGDHVWTTLDGNEVPYTVAGNSAAEVTLVFVHCWMCDRSFWDRQIPAVGDHYRTVTMDLPGHGRASNRRDTWTIAAYGDDVAGLIRELGLDDVILVGHSMGGPVSLRAAALLPGRVRGIVAVDTLHDAEFEFGGEQVEGFLRAFEADFVGTCQRFVEQMFPEEGVDAVEEHVRRVGCDADRASVGIALMRNFGAIDFPAWFREAGTPIRAINAAASNPTKIEVNRKYADFHAVLLEGVGHYPHMTRPDRFNPLLLEALSEMTRARPGA